MVSKCCWRSFSLAALACLPALAAGPVVFRVSDPINPGEAITNVTLVTAKG
jgi:hypothetical protein